VITEHEAKSISQEVTYSQDLRDESVLMDTLQRQSHHLSKQLRRQGLTARTVKIKLRWPDFETLTRQTTLGIPTDQAEVIYQTAETLFKRTWTPGRPIRLIGVGVTGLEIPSRQLGLWEPEWRKEEKIQDLLAEVRNRFGKEIIKRGL
jgi:DNA polymerase-4